MTSGAEDAPVVVNDLLCYIQQRADRVSSDEMVDAITSSVSDAKIQSAKQLLESQFGYTYEENEPLTIPAWIVGVAREIGQIEDSVPRFVASDMDMLAALLSFEAKKLQDDRISMLIQEVQRISTENIATKASLDELMKLDRDKQQQIDRLRQSLNDHRASATLRTTQSTQSAPGNAGGNGSAEHAGTSSRKESYSDVAARQVRQAPAPPALAAGSASALPGSAAVASEWIDPSSKKRKVRPPTFGGGNTSVDNNVQLQGVKRQAHIFVFRCNPGTTTDALSEFCVSKGVRVMNCERVETDPNKLATFHLVVDIDDGPTVLSDTFFPNYILCRRWILEKRNRSFPSDG
jgi:hypothetical protein